MIIKHISRSRPRHGQIYTKHKTDLSIIIVLRIEQHLSHISQFIKKLSNTEAELKKSVAYQKKACNQNKGNRLLKVENRKT